MAKLGALWWFDSKQYANVTMTEAPLLVPRSDWQYRLLIRMPDYVTSDVVKKVVDSVVTEKKMMVAQCIELFPMVEGYAVQMLHTGSFDEEPETLQQLQDIMKAHNLGQSGLLHDIYLSDFTKTAPEKLKTILREPVKLIY